MRLSTIAGAFSSTFMGELVRKFSAVEDGAGFVFRRFEAGMRPPLKPGVERFFWDTSMESRDPAPPTGPDSPPVDVARTSRAAREIGLIDWKLETFLPDSELFRERGLGKDLADPDGLAAVTVENLMGKIRIALEIIAVGLLQGPVNLATVITGSQIAGTIGEAVSSYAFSNAWDQAATKIVSEEIKDLVKAYGDAAGLKPGLALVSPEIDGYLMANDEVREWGRQQYGEAFLLANPADEDVFRGLQIGGLKWQKSIGGYGPTATRTQYMPANKALILPQDPGRALGLVLGHGVVPASAFGQAGSIQGLRSPAPAPGFYSYAKDGGERGDGVRIVVGWRGAMFVKDPTAVMVATVA